MKKILIITYDMIPFSHTWGGCQRMYFLAQHLISLGHDVKIIALRKDKYNTFGKQCIENVYFTEAPGNAVPTNGKGSSEKKQSVIKRGLRKAAFMLDQCMFNEIQPGNGLVAYKRYLKAKDYISNTLREETYDVAIVSGPPFVVFSTIPLVKKASPDTKIIMDYRDPWNFWHEGNILCQNRERRLQNIADRIVCTNQSLCSDMSHKYGIPLSKYAVFANGFVNDYQGSPENNQRSTDENVFSIVYTGAIGFYETVDGYRDTSKLFEALRELKEEGYRDVHITFVGASNPESEISQRIQNDFCGQVKIIGHVDSSIAKQYVECADACLLLHTADDNSGKYLISGKMYDYIQLRKYILSIAKNETQHAKLLDEYGIGKNSENETDGIKNMLKESYALWKNKGFSNAYDKVNVEAFSRDYQVKEYCKLIEELSEE